MKKRKILLFGMMITVLAIILSVSALAADSSNKIEKFMSDSTYRPVDYSTHKSASTVKLYGNVDYLCMKAYSETKNKETFVLEIYSDSARTEKISSLDHTFGKGTHYEDFLIDLTDFKSGTYYATSYVKKKDSFSYYEKYEKDPDSVVNFKITVDRKGTTISKMRSVFIGYENSAAGPALVWYSVPGAEGYYIYRLDNGKYNKIATVDATDEDYGFYIDTGKSGKNGTAYYKVKAYKGSKTTAYSDTLKVYLLKTPTVKASLTSDGRIKVTWSKVSSSCNYVIYRRTATTDWNMIGLGVDGKLSFHDKKVANNTVYYYTVVAVTDNTVSGYDPVGASVRFIAAPELKPVVVDGDNLTVSWGKVGYAQSYIVYRKEAGTGWKNIATVAGTETFYADKTAEKNKVYIYTVRAVIAGKKGAYSTNGIKGVNFDDIALNDIEVIGEESVKITWNDIGDVSYKVYRKSDTDTNWKLLNTVKTAEYTDKEATYFTAGRSYSYTVKPCMDGIDGTYDKDGVSFIYFSGVKSLRLYGYENSIGLKWEKVENADGYNIYRKAEGEYELIATSDTTSYLDTTIVGDTKYTYKVTYIFEGTEMIDYGKEIDAELLTERSALSADKLPRYNGVWSVYIDNTNGDAYYNVYKKENGEWKDTGKGHMAPNGHIVIGGSELEEGSEYAVTAAYSDGGVTNISNGSFVISYFDTADVEGKVNQDNYSISISWNAVEGAENYKIYNWENVVITLDGSVTEYVFENLTPGRSYAYSVNTIKDGVENVGNRFNAHIVKKAEIKKVECARNGITVTWNHDNSVDKYYLYRKAEGEKNWTKIWSGSSSSYTDTGAVDGTTYYYSLRVKYVDTYSAYSDVPVKITFVKTPKITNVKLSGGAITITWEKSDVVDYYIVYRKETVVENGTSKTGSWKKVYTTKNGSVDTYKDSDVEAGNKYTYGVKAISGSNKSLYNSKTVPFIAAPVVMSAKETTNGIKVTFKQTEGAAKYYIYRKVAGGEWVKVGSAAKDATSYTDKTAEKGIKYTYTVRGVSGTTQSSNYSGKTCTRTK